MTTTSRTATAILALSAGLLAPLLLAAPAHASGGDGLVQATGSCVGQAGTWKLKAKPDDGRIEVEFEVDTNHNGQTWAVKITDRSFRVFTGSRVTQAPSGSFEVDVRASNHTGTDVFTATATRGSATCTGRVSI